MANDSDNRGFAGMDADEQRAIASKGGKASAKARKSGATTKKTVSKRGTGDKLLIDPMV
jgi:hypothetical protein